MPDAALALLPLVALALAWTTRPLLGAAGCTVLIVVAELPGGYLNPFIAVLVVGPWLIGLLLHSRQKLLGQLQARGEDLRAERDTFTAESVRYERARIAREMHDIVAHCMSVVIVQAAAARRLGDPALTREALDSIAATAADAREEIGRLVRLLDPSSEPGPDASLHMVEELVARARATGLLVTASVADLDGAIAPASADAIHRVVQEAVTNALKHAPGAPVRVVVDEDGGWLHVVIVNGPAPDGVGTLHTAGGFHGVAGMRERATHCGGTFDAGPTTDGGWRVSVSLPR